MTVQEEGLRLCTTEFPDYLVQMSVQICPTPCLSQNHLSNVFSPLETACHKHRNSSSISDVHLIVLSGTHFVSQETSRSKLCSIGSMMSQTLFTISNSESCWLSRSIVLMSPAAESDTAPSQCWELLPCQVSLLMWAYRDSSCLHIHVIFDLGSNILYDATCTQLCSALALLWLLCDRRGYARKCSAVVYSSPNGHYCGECAKMDQGCTWHVVQ